MYMCEYCLATKPSVNAPLGLTYGDMRWDAPWSEIMMSHRDFMFLAVHPTPWRHIRGFSIFQHLEDIMHDLHAGVGPDLGGSLLCEFVETGLLGVGRADDLLRELHSECKATHMAMDTHPSLFPDPPR